MLRPSLSGVRNETESLPEVLLALKPVDDEVELVEAVLSALAILGNQLR
jgi:hypothetical protein